MTAQRDLVHRTILGVLGLLLGCGGAAKRNSSAYEDYCSAACGRVLTCEMKNPGCVARCNGTNHDTLDDDYLKALTACIEAASCESIVEDTALETCSHDAASGLPKSDGADTFCAAYREKLETCGTGPISSSECSQEIAGLNQRALEAAMRCLQPECAIFESCLADALSSDTNSPFAGTGGAAGGGTVGTGGKLGGDGGTSSAGSGGAVQSGGSSAGGSLDTGGSGTVEPPPQYASQIDLLLMVDNSISMTDKQALLAAAMPELLSRWANPRCLDANGQPTGERAESDECPFRSFLEFPPVTDIHIGLVTSSLGAHGGQTCDAPDQNDQGQLLAKVRADPDYPVVTWNDSGFLRWDPRQFPSALPPGESDLNVLSTNFRNLVLSAGQSGCGFESSLEAWYRFLIDPDPPTRVLAPAGASGVTTVEYPDDASQNPILVQRSQFLRKNSALVILMLSDENDCSIIDEGQGWLVGQQYLSGTAFHMPRATSVCETNPNDKCCTSCSAVPNVGCAQPASDVNCRETTLYSALDDNLNLRCYDQKRRFGFDFLYPVERYVRGLTELTLESRRLDSLGKRLLVRNPIFPVDGRTPALVFVAGLVGVPWQDLASKDSLTPGAPVTLLSYQELVEEGRWELILGDRGDRTHPPTEPFDKLMFETPLDRTTLFGTVNHPLIGEAGALTPSTASTSSNVINGHESSIEDNSDLQYACIFRLPAPRPSCGGTGCDCKPEDARFNRALCDGQVQTHAKAYPGIRELEVLRGFGRITGNAVPASICPKAVSGDPSQAGVGYVPAVSALVRAMRPVLNWKLEI